jgi:C4-dicarboxylate-binding protein DctP
MSANRPVRLPDDLKGLKMRIRYSTVSEAQMRAVGVSPRVLAYADTFAALQSGAVDGTEHTASFLYAEHLYEVQKYLTLSDHGYLGSAIVVNRRFWEKLPADVRAALEGAVRDATRFANESARKANDDAIEAVKRSGKTVVITLTTEEKAAWKRAFMKVHRDSQGRIPAQVLLSIYSGAGFHAAE